MNRAPTSLEMIQRWMQAVITHPQGINGGLKSDAAQRAISMDIYEISSVVLPSRVRTCEERLSVYADAYYSRLIQCLRELFPALRQAVGDELFDDFAFGYLQVYPSRSYSLGQLSASFVEYMESTRDEFLISDDSEPPTWSRFLVELARMEWTIDDVFDGPGIEENSKPFTQIVPAEWRHARLVPAPSLRLLSFEFPVNDYYAQFRLGQCPEIPVPSPTFLAIHRRNYIVRRYSLTDLQFSLLHTLCLGVPVEKAIEKAALAGNARLNEAELSAWFSLWASEDFFMRLETSL